MGLLRSFARHQGGTIAVYTAVVAIPLLVAVTYAMDLKWAERNRNELKSSADFAVLAAVNNNAIGIDEKIAFAREVFAANYDGSGDAKLSVVADESSVAMRVEATFPSTVAGIVGRSEVDIALESRAELTTEQVICVLALNDSAKDAIQFQGKIDFSAPTCSIYSNSTSPMAIRSIGNAAPLAKGFCAVGGARGAFSPYANSQCRPMPDPYEADFAPAIGDCAVNPQVVNVLDLPVATGPGPGDDDDDDEREDRELDFNDNQLGPDGLPRVTSNTRVRLLDGKTITLEPGDSPNIVLSGATLSGNTYCGGLTIAGDDVRFLPGSYYVKDGPFVVKDGANVSGDEVVIGLGGADAVFRVETEGSLQLSAPKIGAHKGLVIMQDTRNPVPVTADNSAPVSEIMSGGSLSVTGTVYLPTHALSVTGKGSQVGAQAPSTSFIADTVEFRGKGRVTIAVDHEAAGLPPVLPRSEDGARLTR